jgi:hypothetical protein
MLSSFRRGCRRAHLRNRFALLAAGSVVAVAAFAAQAAPASASVYIYAPLAGTNPASVFNAAGCGNPANVVDWSYDPSSNCNGTGSNEEWTINKYGTWDNDAIESFTAHYGGNSMCLNVDGADYAEGTQIIAYNCDGGVTTNEKFVVEPNPDLGYYDLTPYGGATGRECFNIWGGFGAGHPIKLYPCLAQYTNEVFATTT